LTATHRLASQVHPPVMLSMANPTYPYELSKAGIAGVVVVEFIIDKSGQVSQAQVVRSTDRRFERAAVNAVLQWKFKPGEKDGRKVNVRASQRLEFNLDPVAAYPVALLQEGVSGDATVEFIVDGLGRAKKTVVISASRPEFGRAAQAAVETAAFAPSFKDDPRRTRQQVVVKFSADGKGDAPVSESARNILGRLQQNVTFPSVSELPTPLKPGMNPNPLFPRSLEPDVRTGSALVEFFVDEKGKAQLPRVISASAEEFGYAAAQAVAGWSYDPPRLEEGSIAVRALQPFEFVTSSDKKK
jgi:TonB family protein